MKEAGKRKEGVIVSLLTLTSMPQGSWTGFKLHLLYHLILKLSKTNPKGFAGKVSLLP